MKRQGRMKDFIGQYIGRYHILETLGEGGMAIVYKAFDTRLERFVAVKFIRQEAFGKNLLEQMLKRFEREGKSLARLSHPNIVDVYDFGEFEGSPYLVMEYLGGGTLKQFTGTPMHFMKAAQMLLPVANALDYAHKHKDRIIHRDIKPANIMITDSGEIMLTDFGIAKILEGEKGMTITGTGVGVGTPEYMAPEQAQGKVLDGRTDVYGLAIVFYELITGSRPYEAETPMAVVIKQVTDPLPRPKEIINDLPDEVELVLFKALAKEPENRFEDMQAFAKALEKLISGAETLPEIDHNGKPDDQTIALDVEILSSEKNDTKSDQIEFETRNELVIDELPEDAHYSQVLSRTKPKSRIYAWVWAIIGVGVITVLGIMIAILILPGLLSNQKSPETEVVSDQGEIIVGEDESEEIEKIEESITSEVTTTPDPAYMSSDPERLVYMAAGNPNTLDPWLMWDTDSSEILHNVYDTLVWYDREKMDQYIPQLALELPTVDNGGVSSDGLTYTFRIRENIMFHDGTILTPEDIAYTIWQGLLKGDISTPAQIYLEPIMGAGILDITMHDLIDPEGNMISDRESLMDYADRKPESIVEVCELLKKKVVPNNEAMTLTFNLEQAWSAFISSLANAWGAAQSKDWLQDNGAWDEDCSTWPQYYAMTIDEVNETPLGKEVMGTGPYMLEYWKDNEIVLSAFEAYWREEPAWEGGPYGAPRIKEIVILTGFETNERVDGLLSFEVDNITHSSVSTYAQLDEFVGEVCDFDGNNCEIIGNGFLRRLEVVPISERRDAFFNFNISENSENIGSGQLDGEGIPVDFFSDVHVRRAFAYCFDYETYLERALLGLGVRSKGVMLPGMLGYSEDMPYYTFDLDECEKEFQSSNMMSLDGQTLWNSGFKMSLLYNENNVTREVVSGLIQEGVVSVNPNFIIDVLETDFDTYIDALNSNQIPILVGGWRSDYFDTHNWTSSYINGYYGRRQNLPDDLMTLYAHINERALKEVNIETRRKIYEEEFNPLFYETCQALILYSSIENYYEPRYLHGYYGNSMHDNLWYTQWKD
ncbi:MAG: protein kinase [Anaerolineaceae bacterium]|nr:protein kinase [Anaerolineaceae bacterium]